jgi:hypothetical protein
LVAKMSKSLNTGKQRMLLVCGVTAYVACFLWMYINYLDPTWAYFGFNYYPPSTKYVVLAWVLSLLPSLWMPIHLTRPSHLAYWVLYITVIIPSMFVPLFAGINTPTEVCLVMIVFFVAFALTGSSYLFPLLQFSPVRISRKAFWIFFGCLATGLVIWVLAVLHSHLHIVSFADIYDQRNAAKDVGEGTAVSYALMGLTGAINPFLMGFGLYYRRYWLLLTGILGQLLVYSALGTKGSILSIVFIPGVYAVLRVGRSPFGLKVTFGFLAVLAGLCLSLVVVGYDPSPIHFAVLFVILMRTLPMGGLVTAWYYNFFQQNPFTYYSHVTGVNWFVHYPYANFIGLEIGSFYQSGSDLDATAHFWATDGLEALGLSGVLLISVFCALIFWVLDSAAKRHDPRLSALIATYAAYNFANISIFTTLFSGGLTLLILFLYILPPQQIEFAPVRSKKGVRAGVRRAAPSYGTG